MENTTSGSELDSCVELVLNWVELELVNWGGAKQKRHKLDG